VAVVVVVSEGRVVVVVGGSVVVVVGGGLVAAVVLVDVDEDGDVVVLLGGCVGIVNCGPVEVVVAGSSTKRGLPTVVDVVAGRAGLIRTGLLGDVVIVGAVSS